MHKDSTDPLAHKRHMNRVRVNRFHEKRRAVRDGAAKVAFEDLPNEQWRPVVGYETAYEVSNLGRVRRIKPGPGCRAWQPLSLNGLSAGYPKVALCDGDRRWQAKIHWLVAAAFLPPKPSPDHVLNHVDGDKQNNRAANLEWVTESQNIQHSYDAGLQPRESKRNKLTAADVLDIREQAKSRTHQAIADAYGVSRECVSQIIQRKKWKHLLS